MRFFFGPARNADAGPGDDGGEMQRRDRLDDRTADAVLNGRGGQPHGEELADLAAFAAAVRNEAASASPRPNASLAEVLANGISADERELPVTAASDVNGPATRVSGPPKRRTRKMLETITASFAALGMAAKAGIAGATVVAATVGAGAAGVLPDTMQDSFDTVRGEQPAEVPEIDDIEISENDEAETPDGGVDGSEISKDAQDGGVVGADVADDAAGDNGAEGRARADEARQDTSELPDEAGEGLERAEEGKANGGELPDEANGGQLPDEANGGELPDEANGGALPEQADDAPAGADAADDRPEAPAVRPDTDAPVETPAADSAPPAPGSDRDR